MNEVRKPRKEEASKISLRTVKKEFDEIKRKLVERLPEMEEKRNELSSQIASIEEEMKSLRIKKEPLRKELEEIIQLTFEERMDLPLLLKYKEIEEKVKAVVDNFLEKEVYEVYIQDLDWVGININGRESTKIETLNELANSLGTEFNISREGFMITPLEQREEVCWFELGFLLSE